VIDQLGIDDFERIGCRLWYIFPCDTQEESEAWLESLKCYSVNTKLIESFGGVNEAIGVSIIIAGGDRKYRIAFNGVQRAATVDLGKGVLNIRIKELSEDQKEFLKEQEKTRARIRRAPDFPAMIDIDAFVEDPESVSAVDFVRTTFDEALARLRQAVGA
jgi:hypothetical protein